MSETGDLITRIYGSFRGVDFRGEEINISRSPDSLNVWKDYRYTESIRTRPGMKLHTAFTEPVYHMSFYKDMMLVHSGTKLYRVQSGVKSQIYSGLNAGESDSFVFENIWYFKDGKHYLKYNGTTIEDVVGFIPTTSKKRIPGGGGEIYQMVNMLSDYRINTFLSDGKNNVYHLDAQDIDTDFVPVITLYNTYEVLSDGDRYWYGDKHIVKFYGDIEINYEKGTITLGANYSKILPGTDGQDNVEIKFKKKVDGYREKILGCNMLHMFDNRVFISGNPDYPHTVWICSLDDPSYFADDDTFDEGIDTAAIKGIVSGNDSVWIFREPSDSNTSIYYHKPTVDAERGKTYPYQHSSISIGCVGKAINFNDDIVFFSERGMEGISGGITSEQLVGHRSSLVDRKLIAEGDYKGMLLCEHDGYLFVFIGNKAYLADSRAVFTNENHIEYDWFYWELEKAITSARAYEGVLYLGTKDGVYTLSDNEAHIESYWTTPKDKFKAPNKLKTTNKRGCVAESTGDISVYVKTDKTDFELIGTYEDITDSFVSRIKRKKWKDIQLKFHSTTRFSLETVTLEAFIGGYIKR